MSFLAERRRLPAPHDLAAPVLVVLSLLTLPATLFVGSFGAIALVWAGDSPASYAERTWTEWLLYGFLASAPVGAALAIICGAYAVWLGSKLAYRVAIAASVWWLAVVSVAFALD